MTPSPSVQNKLAISAKHILLLPLAIYRDYLGYFLPPRCRFYPSCSHYAYEAIDVHGCMKGSFLSVSRLLKCHPWHEGGFDPVPCCQLDSQKQAFQKNGPAELTPLPTPNLIDD